MNKNLKNKKENKYKKGKMIERNQKKKKNKR